VLLEGWVTPEGIGAFNAQNPPAPGVQWFVLAGSYYDDPLGGAFWEGVPNDGMVSVESVLAFVDLCPDSVACEAAVFPVTHPDWNWGTNLLESPRIIDWILDRVQADLERDAGTADGAAARTGKS